MGRQVFGEHRKIRVGDLDDVAPHQHQCVRQADLQPQHQRLGAIRISRVDNGHLVLLAGQADSFGEVPGALSPDPWPQHLCENL